MDITSFQERLIRLERENRRWKRMLVVVLVVVAAVPLLSLRGEDSDATYRIVYASKFAVRDPRTGKLRAELDHQVMPGGWAGITLWDDGGRDRGEFKVWEDGRAQLLMMDATGKERIRASTTADGSPKLVLDGKEVRPQ